MLHIQNQMKLMSNNIINANENLLDRNISYGTQINKKGERVTLVPFQNVVDQIRTGSDQLTSKIEQLRKLQKTTEEEEQACREFKANNLPYFSMACFRKTIEKVKNL